MGQIVAPVIALCPQRAGTAPERQKDQRNRKIQQRQALETVFPSDDDEDGVWKAWGAPDELGLPNNVPFSSGTEGEQDGKNFENAMRRMFSLQEETVKCNNMNENYKERLEKAHKRLQRDLAKVQCSRTLPNSSFHQISAQVDGVGEIALEQLRSSTWVVKPNSIDEEQGASSLFCVVEMSLNAKPLALKIFQLGKIAMMLSSGAQWQDCPQIEGREPLYIVVTNRTKPVVQPKKILHRYPPLAAAADLGRFGIMHISMDSLIQKAEKAEEKAEKLQKENLQLRKDLEELKRHMS